VFAKDVKDAVRGVVDKLDPAMREQVVSGGLHDVSCLTDPHGLITYLVDNVEATDFDKLVYHDTRISAYVGQSAQPSGDDVKGMLEDMGLGWSSYGNDEHLRIHTMRVGGRFMRLVHHALQKVTLGGGEDIEEDADTPINKAERINCADEYTMIYGEEVILSSLAHGGLLGKLYRGLSSAFPSIQLKHVFSQSDLSRGEHDRLMVFEKGGFTERRKTIRFPKVDFVMRAIRLLMNSIVFVSSTSFAEHPDWKGEAWHGVVARKRRQFSRAGAAHYIAFWDEYKHLYEAFPDRMVTMEYRVRQTWGDPFSRKVQLESCMRQSIADWRGTVESDARDAASKKRPNPTTTTNINPIKRQTQITKNGPGTTQAQPGSLKSAGYDKAKGQTGFDPKLSTVPKIGNDRVCKPWNQTAGKVCNYPGCTFKHACDVKLADGTPCGDLQHNRLGHVAAVGYPQ